MIHMLTLKLLNSAVNDDAKQQEILCCLEFPGESTRCAIKNFPLLTGHNKSYTEPI